MQQPMQQAVQQSMQQAMQQSMQQAVQQSMQQSLQQQEQNMALQQMQQQMMLCPVRVVYETQILVQPGDQIQPNQTLFINPQNPPPWAQNRQMQNQVIYVQQMPNNIIPTVPQHIDQNQLYLQHYQNYQQVIPQQVLQQNQEQRHIQTPNVIQHNMVQNFQPNISGGIPNISDRLQQTLTAMPNVGQTVQLPTQTQHNVATNNVNRNESNTNTPVVQQPQHNQNPRPEIRPVYMNVSQPNQQQVRPSPQVLTVNPIQNLPQTNTNYQPMTLNSIPRSIQTHSVGSQMSPPTFANAPPRIRKVAPNTVNKFTNTNIGVRGSIGQTYRPIQPRPQQFRNNAPVYTNSIEVQPQPNKPMQMTPNIININSTLQSLPNLQANAPILPSMPSLQANTPNLPSMPSLQASAPNSSITFIRPEDQTNTRKRKSESPDDIHKKMAAIQVNITTPIKPITVPQRNLELAQNINMMHKVEQKPNITIVPQPVILNNIETKPVEIKEISKLVENVQQAIQIDKCNAKTNTEAKDAVVVEKDKLVRNTVFTQARGRVLSDKDNVSVLKDTKNIVKIEPENKMSIEMKQENVETNKFEIPAKPEPLEVNFQQKEENDTSITLKTPNNKGMLPVDRCTKQERDFVLTHVLDGIVIQESNVAFPIRDPATRRITQAPQAIKNNLKDEINDSQSNVGEDKTVSENKNKALIDEVKTKLDNKTDTTGISAVPQVKTEDQKLVEDKSNNEESENLDNPFIDVQHATVKSWTIEELSTHLIKSNWNETAALLTEHEIDGESLFLVSKTLLLNIGVKENHANLICTFINS